MLISKPLLAHTVEDVSKVSFPVLASPKLDGIRALMPGEGMGLVSRKYKPIPNQWIRDQLEAVLQDGMDGEIIVLDDKGNPDTFSRTTSIVMASKTPKQAPFKFYVFDWVQKDRAPDMSFQNRYHDLVEYFKENPSDIVEVVPHSLIENMDKLVKYEERMVNRGYEGVMVRDPLGVYKNGRSTMRQGILGKIKRFADAEAMVIGFEELMHNNNVAKKDAFGRTERSTCKDNLVGMDTLGALLVEYNDHQFSIGTGFTQEQRKEIWDNRDDYLNKLIKFKFQEAGQKDAPRFPVWLGWRSEDDL